MVKGEGKGVIKDKIKSSKRETKSDERGVINDIKMLLNDIFDVSGSKGYHKFLFFLVMIDLTWFASVAFDNLLGLNLGDYGEFAWMLLFSLGLIVISNVNKIIGMRKNGIEPDNFASLVTLIIGLFALVVAILSLPQINITSEIMNAIKGIVAVIAIAYVIMEAFIIKKQ